MSSIATTSTVGAYCFGGAISWLPIRKENDVDIGVRKEALDVDYRTVLGTALASLLGGFAVRGGLGLARMGKDRIVDRIAPEEEPPSSVEIPIYVPAEPTAAPGAKQAEVSFPTMAASVGIGLPAIYGGYRLADWLFDEERLGELDDAIEKHKNEYRKLLTKPHPETGVQAGPVIKTAEDLFNHIGDQYIEKTAEDKQADVLGTLAMIVASTLALQAANAGYEAYKGSAGSDSARRKLEAFKARPKAVAMPARAVLSTVAQSQKDQAASATKLPSLSKDETVTDPAVGSA
jgi:hypothetical protein